MYVGQIELNIEFIPEILSAHVYSGTYDISHISQHGIHVVQRLFPLDGIALTMTRCVLLTNLYDALSIQNVDES